MHDFPSFTTAGAPYRVAGAQDSRATKRALRATGRFARLDPMAISPGAKCAKPESAFCASFLFCRVTLQKTGSHFLRHALVSPPKPETPARN
ncbi:MAG: hypothetical protein A3E78_03575 [Alphaproteobacteria bacterium RIFCSPHIGHO2_12_FULL_63_12]|nr:MAG: hypothetical protein A3E78_03575 [Alphaproteobacteria bacterium RIFCSPHIGHO2_12_FULL_63_12]